MRGPGLAGPTGRLVQALAPGSYLVVSHPPNDILPDHVAQVQQRMNARLAPGQSMTARSRDDVARFLHGLELLEPGVGPGAQLAPGQRNRP